MMEAAVQRLDAQVAQLERSVAERFDKNSEQLAEITQLLRSIESRPATAEEAEGGGQRPAITRTVSAAASS